MILVGTLRAAGWAAQPHHHRARNGVEAGQGTGVRGLPEAGDGGDDNM